MEIQKFVLNLSRNLGPQLPALVGKALGRSGQLPSFNFYNPGTRTPSKWKIQQAADEENKEEKRGKEEEEERKRKEKKNGFSKAVPGIKASETSNQSKSLTQLSSTREELSVGKISKSARAVGHPSERFQQVFGFSTFLDLDLLQVTSKGIQPYTQSS